MDIDSTTVLTPSKGWEGIGIGPGETTSLIKWLIDHMMTCSRPYHIQIAQSSRSGIGTNTVVRCACGVGKDITDYAAW